MPIKSIIKYIGTSNQFLVRKRSNVVFHKKKIEFSFAVIGNFRNWFATLAALLIPILFCYLETVQGCKLLKIQASAT